MNRTSAEPATLIGRSVARVEDEEMLRGAARYLDDIHLPGETHAAFVRSHRPHADLLDIDGTAAASVPGVLAVLTGSDLVADGIGGVPWEILPPLQEGRSDPSPEPGDPTIATPQPAMPAERVRYVGQIVAMVIAESAEAALDGVEHVTVRYGDRPAVTDVATAVSGGAVAVDPMFPDNICFRVRFGDREATDAAFRSAAHVTRIVHVQNRGVGAPIETRGYIGSWDGAGCKFTLYATAGKPHPVRNTLARFCFRLPPESIRVVVPRLGGGFGAKNIVHPEQVLVLWAARRIGRPVRWISSRAESFLSDVHSRDLVSHAEMAFDRNHRILALRVANDVNLGAYLGPRGVNPVRNSIKIAPSLYRIPVGDLEARGVHTNTVPTCPIRGAGEPEGQFTPERLLDVAASELGIDPTDLRRVNMIADSELPYSSVAGLTYDCGEFDQNLRRALELSDRPGYPERVAASAARGLLRGFALCNTIEALGSGLDEEADIRCTADGGIVLRIGSMSNGQGHETVYGQIIAGRLGVPLARVRVVQGDTDDIAYGTGTGACRSIIVGGSAVAKTADRIIDLGRDAAARLLEAAVEDITFAAGLYTVAGTDRVATFGEVVAEVGGIDAAARFLPGDFTYPNGAHNCEVEIDPETGAARVARYAMVHDCGTPINPMLVEAQLRGGVVHGLGQAFSEHIVYDTSSGQILSGSFLDYGLPRADDGPVESFVCELNPVPTATNPLGAKAVGEAGVAVAPVLAVNAVVDALRPLGVTDVAMPMTPARIMSAIRRAGGR